MSSRYLQKPKTNNADGVSRITVLIFGALVGSVVYLGYRVIPFYYYYYELQNQMYSLARKGQIRKDEEIRRMLVRLMAKYQIPADPEDLEIIRGDSSMEINLAYDEVLTIPWFNGEEKELHRFEFVAHVNEPFVGK